MNGHVPRVQEFTNAPLTQVIYPVNPVAGPIMWLVCSVEKAKFDFCLEWERERERLKSYVISDVDRPQFSDLI